MRITRLKYVWTVERNGKSVAEFTTRDSARAHARTLADAQVVRYEVNLVNPTVAR